MKLHVLLGVAAVYMGVGGLGLIFVPGPSGSERSPRMLSPS